MSDGIESIEYKKKWKTEIGTCAEEIENPPFILTFHYAQVVGRFCNSQIRGSKEITGISISLV